MDLGFDLFQGYAIERPDIVRGQSVAASALAHVQLAMTLLTDDVEFDDLEEILRREPGLVVQVLQMASVGSHLGMRRQVRTVREALVLLGSTRIRQWVALTILSGQPGRSPDGLATALVRARMTELLARARGIETPEFAFTAGLLSALDLLLSADLDELGDTMDLDDDVKDAAFRRTGPIGALVAEVVRYQECLESGSRAGRPARRRGRCRRRGVHLGDALRLHAGDGRLAPRPSPAAAGPPAAGTTPRSSAGRGASPARGRSRARAG